MDGHDTAACMLMLPLRELKEESGRRVRTHRWKYALLSPTPSIQHKNTDTCFGVFDGLYLDSAVSAVGVAMTTALG